MASEATVVDISAGSSHSVALLDCGTVVSFGRGEDGQLGHGDCAEEPAPKAVHTILDKGTSSVHCGAEYTIAVCAQQQTVYSWGWGDFGRLGHGDGFDAFVPRPISFFNGVKIKAVACGDTHTMVITSTGELFAFGRNQNGQLGLGHTNDMLSPQPVTTFKGQEVTGVAAGAEHTIAVTSTGEVYGWGWGRYGNLGTGEREDRYVPTKAAGLDGVTIAKVGCGWRHSMALSTGGQIYTFGWSRYGQLGHDNNVDCLAPTLVESLKGKVITCVAGGWRHTMACDSDGLLYGWGWNKFGQLGLGDSEDRNSPTLVPKLSGTPIKLLACGWRHTLAVTATGQMFSWGRGVNGQLGLGTEEDRSEPTQVVSLSRGNIDRAAVRATAAPASDYVSPEDRYAVVPGGPEAGSEQAGFDVPMVPDVDGQGPGKKPRMSTT